MKTDEELNVPSSPRRRVRFGAVARAVKWLHGVSWRRLIRAIVTAVPTCNAIALLVQESLSDDSLSSVFPVWLYVGANTVAVLSTLASKICAQLLVNRDFARWFADEP